MNIFYLDSDINLCAKYHCNKHVVKMILEYAQLLSTAHRVLDGTMEIKLINNRQRKIWKLDNTFFDNSLYKATHINHPSAIWARKNSNNYQFLFKLFCKLLEEYELRYNKKHKCEQLVLYLQNIPNNIDTTSEFEEPPQCMPDDCKVLNDSVLAYRNYYKKYKVNFAVWKYEIPSWF